MTLVTARAAVDAIALDEELPGEFPTEALAEAERHASAPGIDDPSLEDWTALPFVTIDGATTRDLDQALYVERAGDAFLLRYAIADASYFVRPRTALFAEALHRGASTYLPGRSIPMLPRALSEGVISLNAGVLRRALVFEQRIDLDGEVIQATMRRGRIRSRAKLSFAGVAELYRGDPSRLSELAYGPSLRALAELGQARIDRNRRRGMIEYRRQEVSVDMTADGADFVVTCEPRSEVERYNEQLSLLCNMEGARFLDADRDDEIVQPLFRVHAAPDPRRLDELERLLVGVARVHGLPPGRWTSSNGQTLADLLAGLPDSGPEGHIARAVHRQALITGTRSVDSATGGSHYGVGAERYARFSAPMREIAGVYCHKEALEKLGLAPVEAASDDLALREVVIESAGRARERQRRVEARIRQVVLERFLTGGGASGSGSAKPRLGTVMGLTPFKVHVTLDEPPLDVKVYVAHLERQPGDRLSVTHGGAALSLRGEPRIRLGDRVGVRVVGRDDARDRWVLELTASSS